MQFVITLMHGIYQKIRIKTYISICQKIIRISISRLPKATLRYIKIFNYELSLKLQMMSFLRFTKRPQNPVTRGDIELQISCVQCNYISQSSRPSVKQFYRFGIYIAYKRFELDSSCQKSFFIISENATNQLLKCLSLQTRYLMYKILQYT